MTPSELLFRQALRSMLLAYAQQLAAPQPAPQPEAEPEQE
jgi:hypothetical protein